jgi:hypothetical protein
MAVHLTAALRPRLYGRRTSSVRVLWVVVTSLALHTGHMAVDAGATTFVTGAAGFIGPELTKVLVARGDQVFAGTFARLANRPLRFRRLPAVATRPVVGPVLADYPRESAVFSNIPLRGGGIRFRYPTLELGLQQVIGALYE